MLGYEIYLSKLSTAEVGFSRVVSYFWNNIGRVNFWMEYRKDLITRGVITRQIQLKSGTKLIRHATFFQWRLSCIY